MAGEVMDMIQILILSLIMKSKTANQKLIIFTALLLTCCHQQPLVRSIACRTTYEIESNNWTIGCEVLDRDYTNYHYYNHLLDSLGCKTARLQGGWAKTEKVKGVYQFEWLDTIVNDLIKREIRPWVQLSYGNPIYEGGGGSSLGAGTPHSEEALVAWDNWVQATVERYKDKVYYWEVWNEGNLKKNNDPSAYAGLYIRTATIIKRIQPDSKISALALAGHGIEFTSSFLHYLDSLNKIWLIDEITFHPYSVHPEASYKGAESLRKIIGEYSSEITLKQGENGAPSSSVTSGALSNYDWNENRQAKWFLRRMLSDLGHDIPSSIFTIIDFEYPQGQHTVGWNEKGILAADKKTGKVAYKKPAYRAIRNVTSIFDNQLKRVQNFSYALDTSELQSTERKLLQPDNYFSIYGYVHEETNKHLIVMWLGAFSADQDADTLSVNFCFPNVNIEKPWIVNLLSGEAYQVKNNLIRRKPDQIIIKGVPVSDSPIVIADKSLIKSRI